MIVSGPQHPNGTHPLRHEQRGPGELPIHGASAAESTPATADPGAPVTPAEDAPPPAGWELLLAELRAVRLALEAQAAGPAELLDSKGAAALSRATCYRPVVAGNMPGVLTVGKQMCGWRRSA